MNVIETVWDLVMSLFSKKGISKRIHSNSSIYKQEYEAIEHINFTSIFATSLANKAVSDSAMAVKDAAGKDTRRTEWIADGLNKVWRKNKTVVSQALGKGGKVFVPYVQDGKVTRQSQLRIVRDGIVIMEDQISSLRRFKDDVREVAEGYECGVGLTKFNDIKEGDIFEAFIMEEYRD